MVEEFPIRLVAVTIAFLALVMAIFFRWKKRNKRIASGNGQGNAQLIMREEDFLQRLGENYYTPAFFRMKVGSSSSFINLNNVDERDFMLYFHEYVHFLQDVTTTYGLMNISNTSYYIRDAVYNIEHCGQNLFSYPHKIQPKGDFGYSNYRLWQVYRGFPITPMHKKVTLDKIDIQKVPVTGQELDVVFIDITDVDSGKKISPVMLGASIVKESMAYMMEHYVYEPVFKNYGTPYPKADEYPYHICEKVAEYYYQEIATYPVILVALCDLALMNYNPGLMYVQLIHHFHDIGIHEKMSEFKGPNEFVEFLYREGLAFIKGHQYDFKKMQEYVASEMKEYFKCEEFEGNNRWVETVLGRSSWLRQQIPQFMIDIMLYGRGHGAQHNLCFARIFTLLGSPFVFNDNNEATINPPVGFDITHYMPELFWAIQQMFWLFQYGKKELPCQLKNHCLISQKKGAAIVDERCDNAPWSRCLDAQMCPFAVMWKHWGLTGCEPR